MFPFKKPMKKVLEKFNQKYEWIDWCKHPSSCKIWGWTKVRQGENKKEKIRMRVAHRGKQCTRSNYIFIYLFFLFLLVEFFVHPPISHEGGCLHYLSIHVFCWIFQALFQGFSNISMGTPKCMGAHGNMERERERESGGQKFGTNFRS